MENENEEPTKESEYSLDVTIDTFNLENEWEKQSSLFLHYAELCSSSIKERDHVKTQVTYIKSRIDLDIRKNHVAFGFDKKPTETAIQSAIHTHPDYVLIIEKYNQCVHSVNVHTSVKESLNHKKDALTNLTKLWLNSYYAEPDDRTKEQLEKKTQDNLVDISCSTTRLKRKETKK